MVHVLGWYYSNASYTTCNWTWMLSWYWHGRESRRGTGGSRTQGGRGLGVRSQDNPADQVDTIEDALSTIVGTLQNEEPQTLQFPYTATSGSNIPFSDSTTAVSLFDRFFTEEVWDLLVAKTNKYAATRQSDKPHARNWFAVSVDEMRAFVGMLILMGICQMPRLHLYLQIMVPLIRTSGISDIMSRVRFQQIFKFLHLADSAGQVPPGEDGPPSSLSQHPYKPPNSFLGLWLLIAAGYILL